MQELAAPIPMFNIGIVALFSGQKSGWSTNFILKDEQCYSLYRSGNLIMTNQRIEIEIDFFLCNTFTMIQKAHLWYLYTVEHNHINVWFEKKIIFLTWTDFKNNTKPCVPPLRPQCLISKKICTSLLEWRRCFTSVVSIVYSVVPSSLRVNTWVIHKPRGLLRGLA